jgi:hypothetical protein
LQTEINRGTRLITGGGAEIRDERDGTILDDWARSMATSV